MHRLLVALALVVASCSQALAPIASRPAPATIRDASTGPARTPLGPTETGRVVEVVDGDTIRVDRGLGSERVRYIGIDTPELTDARGSVEPLAREATEANRVLVEGREVVLERDVSETDRFGRLLRYVWVRDGEQWLFVNLVLVQRGFAQAATFPPDVRYADLFATAQREAVAHGRGLWGPPPTP